MAISDSYGLDCKVFHYPLSNKYTIYSLPDLKRYKWWRFLQSKFPLKA